MSTSTETGSEYAGETPHADHEAHQHTHPSDATYIKIALILGGVTALEVGTYFVEDASTTLLVATLFPMMIVKFAVVCGWFMHLRFDNPIFRRVFVFGLVLAIVVYCIALTPCSSGPSSYGTLTDHDLLAAGADFWRWQPHPEVWVLVGGVAALAVYALRVVGPKVVPAGHTGRDAGAARAGSCSGWCCCGWRPTGRCTTSARSTCSRST